MQWDTDDRDSGWAFDDDADQWQWESGAEWDRDQGEWSPQSGDLRSYDDNDEWLRRSLQWDEYTSWQNAQPGADAAVDEDRYVKCPLCMRWAARTKPGGGITVVMGLLVAALAVAVGLGMFSVLGPAVSWIGGVLSILIGLGSPLMRRLARPLTIPEDCPHCGGPLRMAVNSEWDSPAVYDSAYAEPRWMPRD
ncbi:MAG: hypothetical protein GF320_03210 [Armatimonadia bacterium]|nr:hypothetical protein [Armatimonadia bacterium]